MDARKSHAATRQVTVRKPGEGMRVQLAELEERKLRRQLRLKELRTGTH
jgi:hypothetical protein